MVGVGTDLWRSSAPTTLLKQGHVEPVAQDHSQMAAEFSPRMDGAPCPWETCASAQSPSQ